MNNSTRKNIKNIISEQLSENKEQGIVDGILNHISGILKK